MDRYFRSSILTSILILGVVVSIHLLWTGTLEEIEEDVKVLTEQGFNPSFMDRYFRRVNQYVKRQSDKSFNPSFMDRYFRRNEYYRSAAALPSFQSIFYGQVL